MGRGCVFTYMIGWELMGQHGFLVGKYTSPMDDVGW